MPPAPSGTDLVVAREDGELGITKQPHDVLESTVEDAVAGLDLTLAQQQAATAAAAAAVESAAASAAASTTTTPAAPAAPAAAAAEQKLSPEQDAAAEQCADAFVELYEHAFLSRAVQQLTAACQQQGLPEAAVAQKLRTRGVDLPQLQLRAAEVQRGIAECASDEGWKLIQDGQLRLMYRHSPGSTVHGFKGSCVLPAPLEQPLSMAREFDLVKTWNNYITHSRILKVFADIDLLVYASVWMPWPFAERDVLIHAVADDQLKEQGVIGVTFASPKQPPSDVELPPGADQRVHIYFTEGSCMTITPVAVPETVVVSGDKLAAGSSAQQTKITIVSNIDTELAHVPEAIISFVLKVFAPFMFKTVLGVLHSSFDDPTQPLPQRLKENHELYDEMRQRCQDFLDGHPQ